MKDFGFTRKVVGYGTSLTASGGWFPRLAGWSGQRWPGKFEFLNRGMPGKASRSALEHLDSMVLASAPDLVFLEFAINDAKENYPLAELDHCISLSESAANLRTLIRRIKRNRPSCQIVLQTMNPAWDAPESEYKCGTARPHLGAYYGVVATVARIEGLTVLDHFPVWSELRVNDPALFSTYVPDGVHPIGEAYDHLVMPKVEEFFIRWLESGC